MVAPLDKFQKPLEDLVKNNLASIDGSIDKVCIRLHDQGQLSMRMWKLKIS